MSTQPGLSNEDKKLYVTKRTVMFDGHVYPTANLSHFGPGKVPIFKLPWSFIIALFLVWVSAVIFNLGGVSVLLFLAFAAALAWGLVNPKRQGVLITMNSGGVRLFKTSDTNGAQRVGLLLRDMLEQVDGDPEEKVVTINDHSVNISDSAFSGPTVFGDSHGGIVAGEGRDE